MVRGKSYSDVEVLLTATECKASCLSSTHLAVHYNRQPVPKPTSCMALGLPLCRAVIRTTLQRTASRRFSLIMSNPVSPTETSPPRFAPNALPCTSPTSSSPLSPRRTFHKRSNTISYDTSEAPDAFFPQTRKLSTHPNFPRPKPSYQHLTNTGSEPGVDVNKESDRLEYEHLSAATRVTVSHAIPIRSPPRPWLNPLQVVDYTSDGHGSRVDIPGEDFEEWLQSEDGQRLPCDCPPEKDKETGKSVRWINVDGRPF